MKNIIVYHKKALQIAVGIWIFLLERDCFFPDAPMRKKEALLHSYANLFFRKADYSWRLTALTVFVRK